MICLEEKEFCQTQPRHSRQVHELAIALFESQGVSRFVPSPSAFTERWRSWQSERIRAPDTAFDRKTASQTEALNRSQVNDRLALSNFLA